MYKYFLVAVMLISTLWVSSESKDLYRRLVQGKCTWSRARSGFTWKEAKEEGCKLCSCVERKGSLWQICKTEPRPTGWTASCKVVRRGCKYLVVRHDNPRRKCKVLAYTTYRYTMWVDDLF